MHRVIEHIGIVRLLILKLIKIRKQCEFSSPLGWKMNLRGGENEYPATTPLVIQILKK